jgi:hypothetical protein
MTNHEFKKIVFTPSQSQENRHGWSFTTSSCKTERQRRRSRPPTDQAQRHPLGRR